MLVSWTTCRPCARPGARPLRRSASERAVQVIPPERRLWVQPDCGLKTRGWPEAALRHLMEAAVRQRGRLHAGDGRVAQPHARPDAKPRRERAAAPPSGRLSACRLAAGSRRWLSTLGTST
ncbi:MAG: hypothetical protein ACOZD0_11705 [Pseudomonadota bacterium]